MGREFGRTNSVIRVFYLQRDNFFQVALLNDFSTQKTQKNDNFRQASPCLALIIEHGARESRRTRRAASPL